MKKSDYFFNGLVSEFRSVFSDWGLLLIFFIALFGYPLAYQYAYKNGVTKDIPVAIFDKDNSSTSRIIYRNIKASNKIKAVNYYSIKDAQKSLRLSKIRAIIVIEKGIEKNIFNGSKQGVVSVFIDGTNLLINKDILMAVSKSVYTFSAKIEVKKVLSKVGSMEQAISMVRPIEFKSYKLFNTKQYYDSYILPSITLLLIQQTLLVGISILGDTKRERKIT